MSDPITEMLADLNATMAGVTVPFTTASAADNVYEAYVFSLVVAAAAESGGRISYYDRFANEVKDLVFRGSPGLLHARGRRFTHAVIRFGQAPPIEVHLRVKVRGTSGSDGECDILIIDSHTADTSRHKDAVPKGSSCELAIECKYYLVPLPIEAATAFSGRSGDRSSLNALFAANRASPQVSKFLWNKKWMFELGLLPSTRQVAYLKALVRETFKKYTAKYDPGHLV